MEEKRFKPMADRVLVKVDEVQERTKSGLYIPKNNQDNPPTSGVIVQIGTGLVDKPFIACTGDRVMFSKFAGSDIKVGEDKTEYKVMRESDLLGFLISKD